MPKYPFYLGLLMVIALTSCTVTDATTLLRSTPAISTLMTTTATAVPSTTSTLTPTQPTATAPASLSDVPPPAPSPTSFTPISHSGDVLTSSSQNDQLPATLIALTHDTSSSVDCTVIEDTLNLREGPGPNYTHISTLTGGAVVSARKCSPGAGWLLVETSDQAIGWVNSGFLRCQSDPTVLPIAAGIFPATSVPTVNDSSIPATSTPTPNPSTPTNEASPPPTDHWQAEYYANASLLGQPTLTRPETEVDFNWVLDSPDPTIPSDNFSARWSRSLDFIESGDYRFFAEADDGVKVYVDGWLVIDAWNTDTPVTHFGDFAAIQKGHHTVVVEYFESGGHAHVKVWAERVDLTQTD